MPRPATELRSGERYGRLLVEERAGSINRHAAWQCLCDCGKRVVVYGSFLKSGKTKSCGCWRQDMPGLMNTRHGQAKKGQRTRVYRAWLAMRTRCLDPKAVNFARYGGAGVTVSDEWAASFDAFYRDMGDPPTEQHTIERLDNALGYSAANCTWATHAEQAVNKRPSIRKYHGKPETNLRGEDNPRSRLTEAAVREIRSHKETLAVYAERYGMSINTIKAISAGRLWRHVV
jgi:hypothetical protein